MKKFQRPVDQVKYLNVFKQAVDTYTKNGERVNVSYFKTAGEAEDFMKRKPSEIKK